MTSLQLHPVKHLAGTIRLPGSKSISNRALLLSALAAGDTQLHNVLASDDIHFMLNALRQLGVTIEGELDATNPEGSLLVRGLNGPLPAQSAAVELFLGLAGTAIRPLAAALTLSQGTFTLDGTERMRERPIGHLVDALRGLGASIVYQKNPGYPPLTITGSTLPGGETQIDGSVSSQFLSSLLLAAPYADSAVGIGVIGEQVSKPYLDITLNLMQRFGVKVTHDNYQRFEVPTARYQSPGNYLVEGDASSATYFLAAGALAGPGITVQGLGANSIQGDLRFLDVLKQMGAQVQATDTEIFVSPGNLQGIDADLNHIPDAAMTVAILALFAKGATTIRNIYNWRVKETDRLDAMAAELRKLGAKVQTTEDSIHIEPPQRWQSAQIETYGDHRMAMCFSLAALGGVPVEILDPGCVAKTFPSYFDDFERMAAA